MGENVDGFCSWFRSIGLIPGFNSWSHGGYAYSSMVPASMGKVTQDDFGDEYLDVNGGDLSEAASALCQMTHLEE